MAWSHHFGHWSGRIPEHLKLRASERPIDPELIPVPTYIDQVPPELSTGEGVRRVMRW